MLSLTVTQTDPDPVQCG